MKNLLVTGRPGSGKTTLVEQVVRRYRGEAGGFLTKEIRERGVRKGFSIATLDGAQGVLAHVDFAGPVRVGKYAVDLKAVEEVAVPAIRRAIERCRIVAIDEIGKMELASGSFRSAVLEAFGSGKVVLATIQQRPDAFTDAIKRRADARIFEITVQGREAVRRLAYDAVAELLGA